MRRLFWFLLTALLAGACYQGSEEQDSGTGDTAILGEVFRVPRTPPVTDISTAEEIDVRDFGAVADDEGNDWEAIQAAFNYMQAKKGNIKLTFSPGIYRVRLPEQTTSTHCFAIKNLENFVVDFQYAQIVIETPMCGFMNLNGCRNGVIRHVVVDYDPLPFTQGVVEMANGGNGFLTVRIDEGFPEPDAENFLQAPECWGIIKDPVNPRTLKPGARNLIPFRDVNGKRWEKLSERTYQFNVVPNYYALQSGDPMVVIARYNGRPTFAIVGCEQVTFDGNTLYAGPAGGHNINRSTAVNIINTRVLYREGRLLSQNADCVHANTSRIGPWIESCVFEGQGDDAINIKTQMLKILQVVSTDTYLLSGEPRLADVLCLFNPREGELLGRTRVLSVIRAPGGYLVKVDRSFSDLRVGEAADCDMFFNDYCSNESFVIRNNIFRNSRRYGMLIQATHGRIENNEFYGLSSSGIVLQNSAGWPEGFVPYNVAVSGNLIHECGFDDAYAKERLSPIMMRTTTCIETTSADYTPPVWKGVRNITVDNNIVRTDSESGIAASDAGGILFKNNQIECTGADPIIIERCENIVMK